MKLLLDMNLPPRWREFFRKHGHICEHWSEIGDPRANDRDLMQWARLNEFALLTHDLDFGAMLAATQAEGPSVIQIRTQDVLSPDFSNFLLSVVVRFESDIVAGALIVVSEERSRVRILPLRR